MIRVFLAVTKLLRISIGLATGFIRSDRPGRTYAGTNSPFCAIGASHFAIRRKFCTVAAIRNSSLAPLKPRNLNRSSLRILLRCANSISTFFLSLRDCLYSAVLAIARATSRADSCTLRAILRTGVFGQHRALIGQTAQSDFVAW